MYRYKRFINSEEAWLPQIPEHWGFRKIKYSFNERNEKNHPEAPLLVASQNMGVVPKDVYGQRTVVAQTNLETLKFVHTGDYVISLRSFQGGIEYAYYQGIISPAYTVMNPKNDFKSRYYTYLFKSKPFIALLQTCVTGIREGQNIDYRKLKNHYIPVPPLSEQNQIVRFLDWKVSEINKLVNIYIKEITDLEKIKNQIILKAITGGLHKNTPTTDSGNTWIGKIPKEWKTAQIRRVANVTLGKMLAPVPSSNLDTYEEYICAKDVHFGKVNLTNLKKMWFSPSDKRAYQIQAGDLLIVEGGAGAGNAAVVESTANKRLYIQNSIHIVRPIKNRISTKFLCFWMQTLVNLGYMKYICSVATIPHFTKDKVLSTVMPLPPIEEQLEIVKYLESLTNKIDNLSLNKREQISCLNELKSTTISDVVTGKVDIRDIIIPQYEHFDDVVDENFKENIEDMSDVDKEE